MVAVFFSYGLNLILAHRKKSQPHYIMPPIRNDNHFRFQGRRALLTYSRVGDAFTSHQFALDVIEHIRPLANAHYKYRWAVEVHHDEGIDLDDPFNSHHVHIVFDLGKCCTERGQIFDFGGFHPNVKPCGGRIQWRNQVNYLAKDGFFGGNTDEAEEGNGMGEEIEDVFRKALEAETMEEFTSTIADGTSSFD
jgi:hypothetical protein